MQDRLVNMIKETSGILLSDSTEDLKKTIFSTMELLVKCVDADRARIWRPRIVEGKTYYAEEYVWPEKPQADASGEKNSALMLEAISEWEEIFSASGQINSPVSLLSETSRKILSPLGILSILVLPIFLEEKFWGIVSFEDCKTEKTFSKDEVISLHSRSLLIASKIVNSRNKAIINTRIKQQELMAAISSSFISRDPMDKLINNALEEMGKFMGVTRVLAAKIDEDDSGSRLLYTWVSSDQWKPKPSQKSFKEIMQASFPKSIPDTGYITAICCGNVYEEYSGRYASFGEADVKSFIWAPVYVDCSFWGLISVEECREERIWSESDVQLVGTITSAVSGAVARELIEKARAEALEQAVNASRAKGHFVAHMSHEMRTPMNAIIGMTSIGKNSNDIAKKDYAFEKIEDASLHLLGVINDVLDMSKIEANKLDLSPVTFSFEKMLRKVVNIAGFRINERRQEFTVEIDKNIPPFLVGDDQRLNQVIVNLLSNAAKFTPENGSIRLVCKYLGEENGVHEIQIEVSDSGIGISQEQQERLFSSFVQASNDTTRKFGGTGLGLAISKRIVELMNGRIWIESEMGKGATFAFTIKAEKGEGKNTSLLAPGVNIKNIRTMIVDDNMEVLNYFSDLMMRYGINCDTVSNGEEALSLVQKNGSYDLYFIDWEMPGMDGIELSRHIKKASSEKAVIIMISAVELSVIEAEAKSAGVDKFLSKPIFPSSIVDAINECLNGNDLARIAEEAAKEEETANFESFTMLLAEDIDINREIVFAIIEPTNIQVEYAETGKEAVDKFTANPEKYDIIFMDIQMPEMDGYEAAGQIRIFEEKSGGRIPIVAMTANVFKEDIEKCLSSGMDDHVGKPLDSEDVINKLKKYLARQK